MTKITLNPVNYYDINDVYSYEVDNRPLYDISSNIDIINNATALLGFYQELQANPDTEPANGFPNYVCAYVGANGLLYPIDISQSILVLDYATVPIYLIIKSLGSSKYSCISFSASLTINSLFNKFMAGAIGHGLKVGPGGALVDEVYFDLYYSVYGYQNIFVGKILTPTTISFGGNQVNILSDNTFLSKDMDDSTIGLITKYINNATSATALKNVLVNSASTQYPFIEYINQIGTTAIGFPASSLPVYFTSVPLQTNPDGSFVLSTVENVLNEIHFASPNVSGNSVTDSRFGTAGVNISTLFGFSQNYLLHSQTLSHSLSEISQNISTSLLFTSATASSTNGLFIQFDSVSNSFGLDSTAFSNIPTAITAGMTTTANGIAFDTFKTSGLGAFVGYLSNSNLSTSTYSDSTTGGPAISALVGSNALALVCKSSAGNALISLDTDYLLLNTSVGTYYSKTASLAYEITNKGYVDAAVNAAINTAKSMVPLIGNSNTNPITGSLYLDLTSSSNITGDSSTVLQFNTMLVTAINSSNPVSFRTSDASAFQVVRGFTPFDNDIITLPTADDFATRNYLQSSDPGGFVTFLTTALPSTAGLYLALGTLGSGSTQTVYGDKTFIGTTSFQGTTLATLDSGAGSDTPCTIVCSNISTLTFNGSVNFRLQYATGVTIASPTTSGPDPDQYSLIPRKYLDDNLSLMVNTLLGPGICGTWPWSKQIRTLGLPTGGTASGSGTISLDGYLWNFAVSSVAAEDGFSDSVDLTTGQGPFWTYFSAATDGSLIFNGIQDPAATYDPANPLAHTVGSRFVICVSDGRETAIGDAYHGGIFRTETCIGIKRHGTSDITVYARNIHQDDTDGNSINTLVGSSCSTSVKLEPGDQVYLLSQDAEFGSGSIARLR